MSDISGIVVLDRAECVELLGTVPIGRIAFTADALPAVQPVNFVVHDGAVLFSTTEGSKLAAATRHSIVAFEADEFDLQARTGWNVTVVGRAEAVSAADVPELAALPLRSWLPGRTHFIRIPIEVITGRRLRATEPAEQLDGHPRHRTGEGGDGEVAEGHRLEVEDLS